ncbi:DUF2798 domain-containing protein [Pseudomonas sp. NA-150]
MVTGDFVVHWLGVWLPSSITILPILLMAAPLIRRLADVVNR